MKVVILGSGYVGLVTGVGLAEIGHQVICVDSDPDKVNKINKGIPTIHEEGLESLLKKNVSNGRLTASVSLGVAMVGADISMIAVGTPFDGFRIDLSQIKQAAQDIGECLNVAAKYHVVCVKSTVIPGTTQDCVGPIIEKYSARKVGYDSLGLCMNPEFLAEGTAIRDFMSPDRIIIGANDTRAAGILKALYTNFDTQVCMTNLVTAEMTKYAANSFLATVISYANDLANLCGKIENIDVVDVLAGVNLDKRLSPILPGGRITPGLLSFLHPGPGFGGSCFPKDVKALFSFSEEKGSPLKILKAVMEINSDQPEKILELLWKKLKIIRGKSIGILGLSFKPNTDDVRESPSISVINQLLKEGAQVIAHDPIAIESMRKSGLIQGDIQYENDIKSLLNKVEAIVIMTTWSQYSNIDSYITNKDLLIVDARRFLNPNRFLNYSGIGLLGNQ